MSLLWENAANAPPPDPPARLGRPVGVVVVDSGVDADAATAALQDAGGRPGVVARHYDFIQDRDEAIDERSHGSVVAALVSSVAPGAELCDAKVIDANNYSNAFDVTSALVPRLPTSST